MVLGYLSNGGYYGFSDIRFEEMDMDLIREQIHKFARIFIGKSFLEYQEIGNGAR